MATTNQNTTVQRLNAKLAQLDHLNVEDPHSEILILILSTIRKALNKLSLNFNPNQSAYLEELLDEIQQTYQNREVVSEKQFEELLWNCNFNSRTFFLYLIKRIEIRVNSEEALVAKLELLAFELKKVNQVVCDHSVRFTEKYPSLQDIISNWLIEEINFLRAKRELGSSSARQENIGHADFKIALDLSVAQFSCLVRGLMEKKLILNTNLTELATFLSGAVVTKRSENISEGSFRRKYYQIEDTTKKSVIEALNKTIDWLMKN